MTKQVATDAGTYAADCLVVALGTEYDWDATPGSSGVAIEGALHAPSKL
jgi:hypothetical protein